MKTEVCSSDIDPGCDHICIVNPIYGPLCSCKFGYRLYEDSRACVLTKEYLEAEEKELEEDFAIPVTIICLVGGIGTCLGIINRYSISRLYVNRQLSGEIYLNQAVTYHVLVIFIMSAITWYYLTRTEDELQIMAY